MSGVSQITPTHPMEARTSRLYRTTWADVNSASVKLAMVKPTWKTTNHSDHISATPDFVAGVAPIACNRWADRPQRFPQQTFGKSLLPTMSAPVGKEPGAPFTA